ncbi:aminoglycoside phosphotransferase [Janibacter limosus]|jgi:hypothetical protein|uniref:Aminoglycoside phosphotransferase n=1 Tax=Janibacter limosus TaxID=53458 RepID=A0A4P6MVM2_9MICO|nr:aminoglycoside phosphotransferase [Janibacter limosus]QBF45353.1 aminoglycoside phosphotransferase [Janibacter limosus]
MRPSEHVLDLFAVPGDLAPVPGGQGRSVRAGDLVLSPDRDPATLDRLNPALARLAADLDTRPGRDRRDLRIAMPVPARDGSWVVEGWGATRYEPGTQQLRDLTATRAVGAILHAELARAVSSWPPADRLPTDPTVADRWSVAERTAFEQLPLPSGTLDAAGERLLRRLSWARDTTDLGPDQLVHGDLAGNILLDPDGAPVVIDVSPYWRPALWAEAIAVLDSVLRLAADPDTMTSWTRGARRQAMLRAAIFRLLSDRPADGAAYEEVLAPLLVPLPR